MHCRFFFVCKLQIVFRKQSIRQSRDGPGTPTPPAQQQHTPEVPAPAPVAPQAPLAPVHENEMEDARQSTDMVSIEARLAALQSFLRGKQ